MENVAYVSLSETITVITGMGYKVRYVLSQKLGDATPMESQRLNKCLGSSKSWGWGIMTLLTEGEMDVK